MEYWCKNCGTFLDGPVAKMHQSALCEQCASDPSLRLRGYLAHHPHAASEEVVMVLASTGMRINERMVEYVRQFVPVLEAESFCVNDVDTIVMSTALTQCEKQRDREAERMRGQEAER